MVDSHPSQEAPKTRVKCADGTEIPVYCAYNATVLTELVAGNPKNPNQHPPNQIDLLAKIIRGQGWRAPITISTRSKMVVKGHGRLEAAKALGCECVPVDYQDYDSEEAEIADLLADNKIAELAHIDNALELSNKAFLEAAEFDLELAGFEIEPEDPYDPDPSKAGNLQERFIVPPFSILDTRQGYWQERRKHWSAVINDQGETREETLHKEGTIGAKIGSVSILDAVLAEIVVEWFGLANGKAFDPFAGDTVFGFVAGTKGQTFTGIELRSDQAKVNQLRCDDAGLPCTYHNDDGQNLEKYIPQESQDLLFSCPPYLDLEKYSDDPRDLSNMSHSDFFKVYSNVFQSAYGALKPDRFACIVTSEVRAKGGAYAGLVPETIRIMQSAGFQYYNELILINSAGTVPIRVTKSMNAGRKVGRVHQNVLVFFKGDPGNIKGLYPEFLSEQDAQEEPL